MHANGSTGYPYRDALVDAVIAGGAAVVGLAAGTTFFDVRADPASFAWAASVAFFVAFFASIRTARGPKKP